MALNPRIIRRDDIVARVPDRWARQYAPRGKWSPDKDQITDALASLKGTSFTAEQVDSIIGNNSWTKNCCDGCDKDLPLLVRIGDDSDYETRYLDLCLVCARETFEAIGRADVNTVSKSSGDK